MSGRDPARPGKGVRGLRRVTRALGHSWSGLGAAFRNEAAFRQELLLLAAGVPLALSLEIGRADKALLIGSLLLILVVELLNSAVEAVVDRVSAELHPLSKQAKDIGSAAVLMALINAAAVWLIVLWPS